MNQVAEDHKIDKAAEDHKMIQVAEDHKIDQIAEDYKIDQEEEDEEDILNDDYSTDNESQLSNEKYKLMNEKIDLEKYKYISFYDLAYHTYAISIKEEVPVINHLNYYLMKKRYY